MKTNSKPTVDGFAKRVKNTILRYNQDMVLVKITVFPSNECAKEEFERITRIPRQQTVIKMTILLG